MSDDRPADVLGSLPRTRPHRRSEKRGARPAVAAAGTDAAKATEVPKPDRGAKAKPAAHAKAKPAAASKRKPATAPRRKPATATRRKPAVPEAVEPRRSSRPGGTDLLGTAVQAAAELAEIGLSAGARAVRRAVSRLPRP